MRAADPPRSRRLVTVCAACGRARDRRGRWRTRGAIRPAGVTHGICPACRLALYPDVPPGADGWAPAGIALPPPR
jgi:hypothetical protein